MTQLFDPWPEKYDQWFESPIGRLVKKFEGELIHELLNPCPGENLLDAGCGTGMFTHDLLAAGVNVVGLEISWPMLIFGGKKLSGYPFSGVQGDMLSLPFKDHSFDKAVSVTALEFIADSQKALDELFRVTRPGGRVVVATLNRLSPWADRRQSKTRKGVKHILENAFFRSPGELLRSSSLQGEAKTAIHFQKDDHPNQAVKIERRGRSQGLDTGAFLAARWDKPRPPYNA
jgi:ubiquinone/menaquinone biosynthesis C-methylase UbiE